MTLPPVVWGGGGFPVARGLQCAAGALGGLAVRVGSGPLPGGRRGRLGGEVWGALSCCVALIFVVISVFDCVFVETDVCFLLGGIRIFLGCREGVRGGADGGVGAGLKGVGDGWTPSSRADLHPCGDVSLLVQGFLLAGGGGGGAPPGRPVLAG